MPLDIQTLLNISEIESAATQIISKESWAYYYSASDDLVTKRINNEAYRAILMRPRVFRNVALCDTSTSFLGHKVSLPFFASPVAMARLAHPVGEAGIAQACAKVGTMQIISNNASLTPEEVVQGSSKDQFFGFQMYVQIEKKKSEEMLQRINKLSDKIKFICLTVDAPTPGKREDDERTKNVSSQLEGSAMSIRTKEKEALSQSTGSLASDRGGIGATLYAGTDPGINWKETLPWLKKHTDLPIVVKGIQTYEDAYLAASFAPHIKAIIISNHGGRGLDTSAPAVYTLLEIRKYCPEVFDKVEVWIDGGIKRGTDIVKALCLGAKGVGLGRSTLWGLGVGGAEGVDRVFESKSFFSLRLKSVPNRLTVVLKAEVETCMRLLGVTKISELNPRLVNTRSLDSLIWDGPAGLDII
jgi:L-lactate dehydrogenase (cytochrome)